jgi:hypothetical protein
VTQRDDADDPPTRRHGIRRFERVVPCAGHAEEQCAQSGVDRAEETLELLMGERVEPRKNWLIEAAGRIDQETIDA